jgi:hypothetical protein
VPCALDPNIGKTWKKLAKCYEHQTLTSKKYSKKLTKCCEPQTLTFGRNEKQIQSVVGAKP